jgi:hypothetical protein
MFPVRGITCCGNNGRTSCRYFILQGYVMRFRKRERNIRFFMCVFLPLLTCFPLLFWLLSHVWPTSHCLSTWYAWLVTAALGNTTPWHSSFLHFYNVFSAFEFKLFVPHIAWSICTEVNMFCSQSNPYTNVMLDSVPCLSVFCIYDVAGLGSTRFVSTFWTLG